MSELARCRRAATLIEFALIFPMFLLVLLSALEIGLINYTSSIMDSISVQVSRYAKTGFDYSGGQTYSFSAGENEGFSAGSSTGYYSVDDAGTVIMNGREGFLRDILQTSAASYLDPERLTLSTQIFGSVSQASFSANASSPYDFGADSQAVAYTVTYRWRVLSPFLWPIFGEETSLSSSTVVKNEDFDDQILPQSSSGG